MKLALLRNEIGNASFGARLLVILYAAGIVAIGWQPIRQEKGTIFSSISAAASKIGDSFAKARERRGKKVGEEVEVEIPAKLLNAPSLDKVTDKDREELNKLIEDL